MTWDTRILTDKAQIHAYLQTDRLYAAYAIGDLEPGMFEQSTWAGAEQEGQLRSMVLHFRGLALPALLLMGDTEGLRAILARTPYPDKVQLTCRASQLAMSAKFYAWEKTIPMWRMVLDHTLFRPTGKDCVRLGSSHVEQLAELYTLGGGPAFGSSMVTDGVFYGVFADDRLVSAAGTHLVSPSYGVAAVGNVFTHPGYRGRGFGTATTSAVLEELVRRNIDDIVLNVSQSNDAAIRIYERLGFTRYCPFLEGPASAKD